MRNEFEPAIRWAPPAELKLYTISDNELEALSSDNSKGYLLDFAIFLLSSGITLLITLFTLPFTDQFIKNIYIILTSVSWILGIFFLVFWYSTKTSIEGLVQIIRNRLPPEGIQEEN